MCPHSSNPKKNTENICMCVDLSHLNQYLQQEQYMSPTPAEAIANIAAANAKYFTVLDAMKDYHQCLLDQDSQLLTAFIIPFGRFKYLHAPYGISRTLQSPYGRSLDRPVGISQNRQWHSHIWWRWSHSPCQRICRHCANKQIGLNVSLVQLKSHLQVFGYLRRVIKLTNPSQMQYHNFQNQPTAQNCIHSLDWLINFPPVSTQ